MFSPRDSCPIYEQIANDLRQQILAGILQSGDKLQSVREMAAEYSINPNTIQRAYQKLESDGWIMSIPGKGSFVCRRKQPDSTEKQRLLQSFDDAAAALQSIGVSPMELIARLTRLGGSEHA